ncbi:FdhD protein [Colwellia chukchiensis]|uniref:Sulfur carrier protein FdhD n=1 Tax=Colwellia chukchiensis TaxID=641665 RepID=A0A1H7SLE0_9GAMM|nr:formate dehydrogenase accessory sulfurtransferase FdhD [Colwellia chukchiensis]SEL73323.1 FdhD protein [Colwellia chukchiensis]
MKPMSSRPALSAAKANKHASTQVSKISYSVSGREIQRDHVLTEQPLQIRLCWQHSQQTKLQQQVFSITMRTPGDDKALIIGLMLAEGIISQYQQLESVCAELDESEPEHTDSQAMANQWQVKLKAGIIPELKSLERFQVTYSSCGLCGTTSLKSLEMKNPPSLSQQKHWLSFDRICQMPDSMRAVQAQFIQTGGSHAAALFDQQGKIIDLKEDIGRHNALDKLFGASLTQGNISGTAVCVLVSGRISFEIVQKTVMAGVGVLIAVGAPSALAILAAKRFDLTLIGFVKNSGFNLYHGDWRLLPELSVSR